MLIFFEIDKINVERYYFNRLKDNFDTQKVVVVLEDKKEYFDFKESYPEIQVFLFKNWIHKHCKDYQNSHVVINGNRIPDLLMAKISHQNNCKVIYIQHGLYVKFMKREYFLFIRKLKKAMRYASYAVRINKIISLFLIHVMGYSRRLSANNKIYYPDFAFVYSQYWKNWHKENYFFDKVSSYNFLKNNDANLKTVKVQKTAIYCYQTLVEDGRIELQYFKSILNKIIKSVEDAGLKLVIKGHPRMSESSRIFFSNKGIKIIDKQLPSSGVVIGHYSSLLARWVYEGDKLYLIKLKGHKIPDYLKNLSQEVCNISDLTYFLSDIPKDTNKKICLKEKSDFYFNFSGENSVYYINDIIKKIK